MLNNILSHINVFKVKVTYKISYCCISFNSVVSRDRRKPTYYIPCLRQKHTYYTQTGRHILASCIVNFFRVVSDFETKTTRFYWCSWPIAQYNYVTLNKVSNRSSAHPKTINTDAWVSDKTTQPSVLNIYPSSLSFVRASLHHLKYPLLAQDGGRSSVVITFWGIAVLLLLLLL